MPKLNMEVPYFLQNTDEQPIAEESKITGEIPSWLRGAVLAVTPGIFDLPKGSFNHWLDGLALLTRFEIGEKSVKFSKRFVQSEAYKKAIKAGMPCSVEIGTNPSNIAGYKKGMFSKLKPFGPYDSTDNCIGTVCKLGHKYTVVLSETVYFHKINPYTLETLPFEGNNVIKAFDLQSICPYMIEDPENGDIYSVGSSLFGASIKYNVVRMEGGSSSLTQKFETICTIPSRWFSCVSLQRGFGITKNYVVFVEQPVVLNALKLAATNMKSYVLQDCIEFKVGELNRFYVLEKRTGNFVISKYEFKSEQPFQVVSVINAFEDGNSIVFDCVTTTTANLDLLEASSLKNLRKMETGVSAEPTTIQRFIIPLLTSLKDVPENTNLLSSDLSNCNLNNRENNSSTRIKASAIRQGESIFLTSELPFGEVKGFDFGQINQCFIGKKYSHYYATSGLCSMNSSKYFRKLCKVNVNSGEIKTFQLDGKTTDNADQYIISSPLFVPKILKDDQKIDISANGGGSEIKNNDEDFIIDDDDNGVLICTCLSRRELDRNFIIFIDAKSFKEIARAYFKGKIPLWVVPAFMK